jgi:hypothetical protein
MEKLRSQAKSYKTAQKVTSIYKDYLKLTDILP